ncbi:MAG: type III pantothenate kinase [Alphaproteobacteria bacterium]|nr:type III pantothenate kinase [Alphaproteobacteria bacterium]
MLLVVDIGNTNVVFALCDEHRTVAEWRIRTDAHRTADEYAVWLFTLMEADNHARQSVRGVIISSVVPEANFELKTFARKYLNQEPLVLATGQIDCGMPVKIDNPKELGADRIINAFAAWSTHNQALIVVDFGTATTFDVVSGKGEYMGGVIAPGINLSLEALQHAAAKLHGIAITHPKQVIGTNTTAAMQSGIFHGYAGLIEGIVARIKEERGEAMKVIATGGLAALYADATSAIDVVDQDLTIRGLRLIYQRQKRNH